MTVECVLDEFGCLEVVMGKDLEPTKPVETASAEAKADYSVKLEAWTKRWKKATSIVVATCTSSVLVYLEGCKNPVEMWKILEEKFAPKTATIRFQLMKEFMNSKIMDSSGVEAHIQRLKLLKIRLEEQGELVSDTLYNTALLSSVEDLEGYKNAVASLKSVPDLNPENVINRLLEEYRKRHGNEEGSGKIVLYSKSKSGKASSKKGGEKCPVCEKNGHGEDKCWQKHPNLKPKWVKKKDKKASGEDQKRFNMMAKASEGSEEDHNWYLDSGASQHLTSFRENFVSLKELDKPWSISTYEGTELEVVASGTVVLKVIAGDEIVELKLHDVGWAPNAHTSLLSTTTLYDKGYETSMKPGHGAQILKDGILVADTFRSHELFCLKVVKDVAMKAKVVKDVKAESVELWHRRLAHLNEEDVRKLESMSVGMKVDPSTSLGVCEPCLAGKQTRQPSHTPDKRAEKPEQHIHSDLCGPITPKSVGGVENVGFFIDDATRMTCAVGLKGKSSQELLERFKEYQAQVQTELGRPVVALRTDGGGEYRKVFGKYLKEQGIVHETTAPYSPEQNGVSERNNRTVLEKVRAVMHEANIPKPLWMEVVNAVVYIKNRSPTSALKGMTPFEAWYGYKPDLSHLKPIGITAYVQVPKEKRTKLDSHTQKGILVGYGGTNQYRVWVPARNDVVVSRRDKGQKALCS